MQPQQEGIKVAQPGYDIRTAKDYELLFNSSWPTIAIAFDQTVTLTSNGVGLIQPYAHNLGFIPLAMVWEFTSSAMTAQQGRIFPSVDQNFIYFPILTPSTTYYFNIKCYNLNITIPQNYIYIQSAAVNTPYNSSFGIKVAKQNQSIQSNDMRNFILHSRCASPQVLSVVTQATPYNSATGIGNNGGTLTYTNQQGYTPWAFGYAQVTNVSYGATVYEWSPPTAQAYPKLFFNGNVMTLPLSPTTSNGSLVVLRDPLFAPNTVSVVY